MSQAMDGTVRRAEAGNATAFPRPCAPCQPETPPHETPVGQRPSRRARSARHGRGGRWPAAFGATGGKLRWSSMTPAMAGAKDAAGKNGRP